jgi:Transglycosylase SLT domain
MKSLLRLGRIPILLSLPSLLGVPALGAKTTSGKGTTYLYTYYDRNGTMVVNNLPPSYMRGQGMVLKHVGVGHVKLAISRSEMAQVLKSPELLAMVDEIANTIGVDPWLSRAVIQAESAFNYKARSRTGALGLMQLMPKTAERFGVLDPFDPRQNITGGTKYLKFLLGYFKGDLSKVIAAYNAGEGAVDKHKGIPPFAETRAYVPRVMELYSKKLVQADPRAAGAMALLKKGRGGFEVTEAGKDGPTAKAQTSGHAPTQEAKAAVPAPPPPPSRPLAATF